MNPINLLLVDDHAMFREGLARALEREPGFIVAGQAGSSTEALRLLDTCRADIVLLDVDLGPERAVDFLTVARRAGFQGQALVVTAGAVPDHSSGRRRRSESRESLLSAALPLRRLPPAARPPQAHRA